MDAEATRVFFTRSIASGTAKKAAIRLADNVATLFLMHLTSVAGDVAGGKKNKNIEPEDIIKALDKIGCEEYTDVFKKGLEEKDEEEGEEESPKKKKKDGDGDKDKKGKAKKN